MEECVSEGLVVLLMVGTMAVSSIMGVFAGYQIWGPARCQHEKITLKSDFGDKCQCDDCGKVFRVNA